MKLTQQGVVRRLALVLALTMVGSIAACKSAPKKDDEDVTTAAADENALGDSDSGKAMGLQTVHFPFDAFVLDSTAKSVLKKNAEILKANPTLKIQIEGHADQRGGIQYNLALGEKRANAARKYIIDQGIDASRVTTISFGEERPIDPAETEEAYAKNRRANFAITSR